MAEVEHKNKPLFKEWIRKGLINYIPNSFVMNINKKSDQIFVEIESGGKSRLEVYEKVFIGAGCINTTGLVDKSILGSGVRKYEIKSAPRIMQAHLKLTLASLKRRKKNMANKGYSLCEYFLERKSYQTSNYWSHTQIGDLNRIIVEKIKQKAFII